MYGAGGGTSIYRLSPLQRRFRDVHAATQHVMVGLPTYELAGRVLLGLETDISVRRRARVTTASASSGWEPSSGSRSTTRATS